MDLERKLLHQLRQSTCDRFPSSRSDCQTRVGTLSRDCEVLFNSQFIDLETKNRSRSEGRYEISMYTSRSVPPLRTAGRAGDILAIYISLLRSKEAPHYLIGNPRVRSFGSKMGFAFPKPKPRHSIPARLCPSLDAFKRCLPPKIKAIFDTNHCSAVLML